jgi:hypothetical protein
MQRNTQKALSLLLYPLWAMAHVLCAAITILPCIILGVWIPWAIIPFAASTEVFLTFIVVGALVGALVGVYINIVKPLFSEKLSEFKTFINQLWHPTNLNAQSDSESPNTPHFSLLLCIAGILVIVVLFAALISGTYIKEIMTVKAEPVSPTALAEPKQSPAKPA